MTCAFVPLSPNELTPAIRKLLSRIGQGLCFVTISIGAALRMSWMYGFGALKCRCAALGERARLARKLVASLVSPKPLTVDQVVNDLQQVNGLEYLVEWPAYRRRVLECQYEAMHSYTRRPYAGRLTLFRAQRQPLVSMHDPLLGWGELSQGGVDVIHVPGNHRGLLRTPKVQILGKHLRSILAAPASPS